MRRLYTYIILTSIVAVVYGCKENNPDTRTTSAINEALYNDWGASKERVIGNLIPIPFNEEESDLITVNLSDISTTIGYHFSEGKLCATIVVSESAKYDYHKLYNGAVLLGIIGSWSVYAHSSSNTLIYEKHVSLNEDKQLNITGFAPILSDSYNNLPSITVTTGSASSISYNTATVSGRTVGYSEQCETGILYGKTSSSLETQGSKYISNKHDEFSLNLSNLSDNTTYYYKAYLKEADGYYYGELRSFKTLKATTGEMNGHSWVDLGLPSGLRWATSNVGANYDADYREWYAWGMTRTTSSYGTSFYDYYGSTSIPSNISGTDYDVARKKWGGSWRIPTFSEFKELKENCSFEWTTRSGHKGALFTGPNGNTIFLPAAGGIGPMYSNPSQVMYDEEKGNYWSATLAYRDNGNMAKYVYFNSSGVTLYSTFLGSTQENYINAFNGMQIRPVTN